MKNRGAINFIKNFSYTLTSNFVSLFASSLVVLVVPRLIGVTEYGYWQLYLFYVSYVGFLQFGWNDGIYLRYGGNNYYGLDNKLFFSQFWMLSISQIIIASTLIIFAFIFVSDDNKKILLIMVSLSIVFMGVRAMPLFILLATNRIREYALITMIGRVLYILLIVIFLLFGIREYRLMIVADLIGKFISLVYSMFCCRDIVFLKASSFYFSCNEALENISVGIKLMFANIASMLIIGVVRLGIERSWDVATFGKVSLTLSISNFMMLFINAIGLIMFPILRRTDAKKLSNIYLTMSDILIVVLLGVLLLYYPLKVILSGWLPKYAESMMYMALIFPMFVYEGKMALLINTYLKTFRKEKLILKINIISLCLSVVITGIFTVVFRELNLAIASILGLLMFRAILAEIYLSKIMSIFMYKNIALEIALILIFVLSGWFINSWFTLLLYGSSYMAYVFIKRNELGISINNLKLLAKSDVVLERC